eukprot:Plantae.Rhodophyta-Hildenbrandia_rubra.ctg26431.p1 GENE.Plantae.Rhodophyta-Hildenbrandia_rubra.ctg26431~~Plantae.Rhodophyta-Hildenbrandia_rubra.ctg26431.p1  ORF type:complete len:234 (-),score=41.25 Plantae.Rhodophyta-Hildenbrandia_rubra.ctg26431:436-1137(-)
MSALPPELQTRAYEQLGETDKKRQESLARLRAKVVKNREGRREGLASGCQFKYVSNDQLLLAFLRCKKFDVDRAFEKVVNFSTFLQEHPEWVEELNEEFQRRIIETECMTVLPKSDELGRRIVLLRLKKYENLSREYAVDGKVMIQMYRGAFWTLSTLFLDVETQINGVVIVHDLQGLSRTFFDMLLIKENRIAIHLIQKCYPMRLKAFNVVREPWYMSVIWAFMSPFFNEKV